MTTDYNNLLSRVMERSKSNLKEQRRKRNLAAILDFASNLLVTVGNTKGTVLSYRKPLLPHYEKTYRDVHEKFTALARDVNGRLAHSKLWNPLSGKKTKERVVYPIAGNVKILSGKFDDALRSYKESNVLNNNK